LFKKIRRDVREDAFSNAIGAASEVGSVGSDPQGQKCPGCSRKKKQPEKKQPEWIFA